MSAVRLQFFDAGMDECAGGQTPDGRAVEVSRQRLRSNLSSSSLPSIMNPGHDGSDKGDNWNFRTI